MTIVISSRLDVVSLKENVKTVVDALKRSNEIFRNVRLNFVTPEKDGFKNEVVPLVFLQTGKVFRPEMKFGNDMITAPLSKICSYLKLFHARSKLVLIFTDTTNEIGDKTILKEALNPFLKQKIIVIAEEEIITGTKLLMDCLS